MAAEAAIQPSLRLIAMVQLGWIPAFAAMTAFGATATLTVDEVLGDRRAKKLSPSSAVPADLADDKHPAHHSIRHPPPRRPQTPVADVASRISRPLARRAAAHHPASRTGTPRRTPPRPRRALRLQHQPARGADCELQTRTRGARCFRDRDARRFKSPRAKKPASKGRASLTSRFRMTAYFSRRIPRPIFLASCERACA